MKPSLHAGLVSFVMASSMVWLPSGCGGNTEKLRCDVGSCSGHGDCDDSSGTVVCVCDAGYYADGNGNCLPQAGWCGNDLVEGYEECDGSSDAACSDRCSEYCACPAATPRERLELHLIDVGQGDAALVISPDGFVMLVDGGEELAAGAVLSYLNTLGIGSVDYTLVSHLHIDHLGATDIILNNLPGVVACFDSGGSYGTANYAEYAASAGSRRTTVGVGNTIDLGPSVQADILHGHTGSTSENLNTVVVRLGYGGTRILLGGDCEIPCEAAFDPGSIQVYKVHHHGSSDSSGEGILTQMQPRLALIPVGADNLFGHPHQAALDRLAAHGASIYRTDLNANLVVFCDGTACALQ